MKEYVPPQAPRIRCGCRERECAGSIIVLIPPQAPRIRCGCRGSGYARRRTRSTASSSENPLRMPLHFRFASVGPAYRLKLRESAADAADPSRAGGLVAFPPQAPRIRCGCRESDIASSGRSGTASSSENPLRMPHGNRIEKKGGKSASSSENPLRMPPIRAAICATRRFRLKLRESAADAALLATQLDRLQFPASSSENPLRMPLPSARCRQCPSARLKLRESAADAALGRLVLGDPSCPPQAPRIRCGCRITPATICRYATGRLKLRESAADAARLPKTDCRNAGPASSSENPLRMPLVAVVDEARPAFRLKLRESAADAATFSFSSSPHFTPPQAPRIRCGCRSGGSGAASRSTAASSSENPLRMPRVSLYSPSVLMYRLKLRESAADAAQSAST